MDWGLIGTILAVIFFGSTVILSVRLAKRKKLVWAYSQRHVIGRDAEAPPELKYVFGTREVTEVYKTTIIFFNKGNEKFCGDLVPIGNRDLNEAVIIEFKGAEILRPPSIQKVSKGVAKNFCAEKIKDSTSAIQLHFPILNYNDGAVIDVWHTECEDIEIPNAEITRLKKFIRKRPEGFYSMLLGALGFTAMVAWMWFGITTAGPENPAELIDFVIGGALTGIYILILIVGLLSPLLRYMQFPRWSRE